MKIFKTINFILTCFVFIFFSYLTYLSLFLPIFLIIYGFILFAVFNKQKKKKIILISSLIILYFLIIIIPFPKCGGISFGQSYQDCTCIGLIKQSSGLVDHYWTQCVGVPINYIYYDLSDLFRNNNNIELTITTDKEVYKQGEEIEITIKNNLNKDILYIPSGDRDWSIEKFKNDNWQRVEYFQLTRDNIGDRCYAIMYERSFPIILKVGEVIISNWNQKGCFLKDQLEGNVEYIKEGRYRLVFRYGFETEKDNPFYILNEEVIYSNEFIINNSESNKEQITFSCNNFGGEWLYAYGECATNNSMADIKGFCDKYGGQYKECESACRHDPNYPNIECIEVCVQVCLLNN